MNQQSYIMEARSIVNGVVPSSGALLFTVHSLINYALRILQYTYSLHCSSFFWFNQFYSKDPKR